MLLAAAAAAVLLASEALAAEIAPARRRAPTWDVTPLGQQPLTCVHQVPSGGIVTELPTMKIAVKTSAGSIYSLPACNLQHINRTAAATRPSMRGPPFSGWVLGASAQSVDLLGFDRFAGSLVAPNLPSRAAAPLFLSWGLQNQDWEPPAGSFGARPLGGPFGLFAAVLRYPSSVSGWGLSLWYMTETSGVVYTTERDVKPGDRVDFDFIRTGPRMWRARATNRRTSDLVELSVANPRLTVQAWASVALSGGALTSCAHLPRGSIRLLNLKLLGDRRVALDQWEPISSPLLDCDVPGGLVAPTRRSLLITVAG